MRSRRVAFGLAATSIALKARTGQLRAPDMVAFAIRAIDFAGDDDRAKIAAIEFLALCQREPAEAGKRLQQFVIDWSAGEIDPDHPQRVLVDILGAENVIPMHAERFE